MASVLPHTLPIFTDPHGFGSMFMAGAHRQGKMGAAAAGYTLRDPFLHGIDHDYGHGFIRPLSNYGISRQTIVDQPHYGRGLDDLYLYEAMLRLDRTIDEQERMRRWRERLQWEELDQMARRVRWREMDVMSRSRLGLGTGSYWGHHMGGFGINQTFGYTNPLGGLGHGLGYRDHGPHGAYGRSPIVVSKTRPMGFPGTTHSYKSYGAAGMMGLLHQPHYDLSPNLLSRYPMWSDGGLGLGSRLHPSLYGGTRQRLRAKDIIRQETIRRDHAERRGEIPPRPLIRGPGLMGTGVPGRPWPGGLAGKYHQSAF